MRELTELAEGITVMADYEYGGRNTKIFQKLYGFKNIGAWQTASDLSFAISRLVNRFEPAHFRLANQMRGAAIGVHGNIAEGYCSGSLGNYIRYCNIARGSLGEWGSYLQDCEREGLTQGDAAAKLTKAHGDVSFLLDRLIQALIKKEKEGTWDKNYWVKDEQAAYLTAAGFGDDLNPNIIFPEFLHVP